MNEYDVVVIGGGPGGYTAAVRASQRGLKTALVERDALGGTCANWGCIPTKTLLKNAEVAHLLRQGKTYGFDGAGIAPGYAAAQTRSRQVARRQERRVAALLQERGVTVISGEATLQDSRTVAVAPTGGLLKARAVILATGGKARSLPGLAADGDKIITARKALQLTEPPATAVIVGAGPIGLEFAAVWHRYGSRVTVLEAMPAVLPLEDEEISREVENHLTRAGIAVRTNVRVQMVNTAGEAAEVTFAAAGGPETVTADKVLLAVGTAPATAGLGLEALGVATDRGRIIVDDAMRTSVPGVFAVGDLTGRLPLAHTASAQGLLAAAAIAGEPGPALVYENIPRCVFGVTEVASVGLTESQARSRGLGVRVVKSPFLPNGKAVATNENSGFVKLVADGAGLLVGAHMAGPHVTEIIATAATVVSLGIPAAQAAQVIYPHPTLSEALLEGFHALAGHAVHL